jgi:flagellar biosynthesis anti-sigma factor FlgM
MGNDPNSSVAPGENSARIAALGKNAEESATTYAKASAEERTSDASEFLSAQSRAAVLASHVNQLPDVREEKVAAIANAVKRGTYQVSPEQTADAILSELDARSVAAA